MKRFRIILFAGLCCALYAGGLLRTRGKRFSALFNQRLGSKLSAR